MTPSYAKRAVMAHRVVIVGAGPSGFYAADGLLRGDPDIAIDIIDRLPTPFGLVRAGVAPDHQGTKAVIRQFDRLLAQPNVRFCGAIEVGRVERPAFAVPRRAVALKVPEMGDSGLGAAAREAHDPRLDHDPPAPRPRMAVR